MSNLSQELAATIRYLEKVKAELAGINWDAIEIMITTLRAQIEKDQSIGEGRVRLNDGEMLDITVDELAWENAEEDAR